MRALNNSTVIANDPDPGRGEWSNLSPPF